MRHLIMLLFLVFSSVLAGCSSGGSDGGGSSQAGNRNWTFMVYMGADNNLADAGISDLNEMAQVGSGENVSIVVQAEFSTRYLESDLPDIGYDSYNGDTFRYLVKKAVGPESFDLGSGVSIGNVNMASPSALSDFIRWGAQAYPADHYALVIWDHGAGWKLLRSRGAVEDETSDSFMTLPELAQGVRDSGVHLDVIDFDACLMGMYEVAYEFLSLADYMVFSEEVEPGSGNPYDTILAALTADPLMKPVDLAVDIVELYAAYYNSSARSEEITKSAVDMSKIDELHEAMAAAAAAIVDNYDTTEAIIRGAQENSQNYYYNTNYDLYDFFDYLDRNLLQGPVKDAAQNVKSAVSGAVIANRFIGDKVSGSRGIAVYAPNKNQVSTDLVVDELTAYGNLACNQSRSNGWYDAVALMMGNRIQDLYPGGFVFYVDWDTDADLDLYVWEPKDIFSPWMTQSTPNGQFSADSLVTGVSTEYYVANDYVEAGLYDVIVNYYDGGATADYANATFHCYLPGNPGEWKTIGPVRLDLSNPYGEDVIEYPPVALYDCSDFWYVFQLYTGPEDARPLSLDAGGNKVNISFKRKKTKPFFGDKEN